MKKYKCTIDFSKSKNIGAGTLILYIRQQKIVINTYSGMRKHILAAKIIEKINAICGVIACTGGTERSKIELLSKGIIEINFNGPLDILPIGVCYELEKRS